MEQIKVGVIGDGRLAKLIISRLKFAGCKIVQYKKNASSELTPGNDLSSPISIGNVSDLIITIQEDVTDLEEVLVGDNGVIHCRRNDNVIIDMSSVSPEYIKEVAEIFVENEKEFLDAAYLDVKNQDNNLVKMLLVGGDKYVYDKITPQLKLLADNIAHIGEHGASQFYRQAFAVRSIREN